VSNTIADRPSCRAIRATRTDAVALVLLAAAVAAPWIPAIVRGEIPFFMDTLTQFYPWRRLAGMMLRAGIAPFWNPSSFGGAPLLANPQAGLLYPGHWPFLAWPGGGMFTLVAVAHVFLCAAGIYAVARRLGCGRAAAWVGGLAAAWNGWPWAHFAFGSYHQVWAWWPWAWWVILAWVGRVGQVGLIGRNWAGAGVALGAFGALQILAGAPQMAFYGALGSALVLGVSWAARLPELREKHEVIASFWRLAAGGILACALALAWSAPQLLPTRSFMLETIRGSGPLDPGALRGGALSAADLMRALFGGTGLPEDAESTAYLGAPVAIFAILALFLARGRRREAGIFLAVGALGAALALRPLVPLWSAVLPGFSHMHDPRRALGLAAAASPVAFALGLDSWLRGESLFASRRAMTPPRPRALAGFFAGFAVLLILIFAWGQHRFSAPSPALSDPAFGWLTLSAKSPPPYANAFLWGLMALGLIVSLWILQALHASQNSGNQGLRAARFFFCALMALFIAVDLFAFAARRIDLKTIAIEGPAGALTQARRARNLLESAINLGRDVQATGNPGQDAQDTGTLETGAENRKDTNAPPPIRFFTYDPTGHYSYAYMRPDAGSWLLPGLAALTWEMEISPKSQNRLSGLCDLQGYDPALPERWAMFSALVNQGYMQLYPRHFALVRAAASRSASEDESRWFRLLGAQAALGPADRYALPVLPPEFQPGESRYVPFERPPAQFRVLHARVRTRRIEPHSAIDLRWTNRAGARLAERRIVLPPGPRQIDDPSTDGAIHVAIPISADAALRSATAEAAGLAIRFDAPSSHSSASPAEILLEIELEPANSGATRRIPAAALPGGASAFGPPLVLFPSPEPYASLDANVAAVPMGEELKVVGRRMSRQPKTTLLETQWESSQIPPLWRELIANPESAASSSAASARSETPAASAGTVRSVKWSPGRIEVEAEVNAPAAKSTPPSDQEMVPGAALVVREPYFEGWTAYVDGAPHPPMPANLVYQAVWLAPGVHRVIWQYRPPGFARGLGLCAAASVAAAMLIVWSVARRKRKEFTAETQRNAEER